MKVMFRQLRRLEQQLAPKPEVGSLRAAEWLRERRQRRLEAIGQSCEELPLQTTAAVEKK
jgi:hypothetical protein